MIFDSIGSLGMGIISMVFAFFLAKENNALLIGEAISKNDYRKIVEIVHRIPEVNRLISLRTIHFAAEDVLVATDVSPKDGLTTDEIESVINHIKQRVKQVIPYIHPSKIYVEVEQDSFNIN
jgi:divalent metal cation (Fe/Co/Zn/Cd) transporter